jgi:hypothetical protein
VAALAKTGGEHEQCGFITHYLHLKKNPSLAPESLIASELEGANIFN